MDRIDQLAERLRKDHENRLPFTPLMREAGIAQVDTAYDVQDAYVRRLLAREGAAPAGYKIGLTSPRMQEMCGIGHPIAGVEFEIGIRVGRDMGAGSLPRDIAEVGEGVAAICPAFELVEDRHADYRDLDVLSLIADNSWNAGAVLGPFVTQWPDLDTILGVV